MKVDLIAHHSIQSGCVEPLIDLLGQGFAVRTRIGPNCIPDSAELAIVTDHLAFQKHVTKKNYKFLVHMSHDISDIEVYKSERKRLSEFDLILCPGLAHYEICREYVPSVTAIPSGWLKYSYLPQEKFRFGRNKPRAILLAITEIGFSPWQEILDQLIKTDIPILVKNHVYYDVDAGLPAPPGLEIEYTNHISELSKFSNYVESLNSQKITILDPKSRITTYFSEVDVLVTDWSSAAVEFLPFGESIETGRFRKLKKSKTVSIERMDSNLIEGVHFVSIENLVPMLISNSINQLPESTEKNKRPFSDYCFFPQSGAGAFTADVLKSIFGNK